jgi:cytochrome b involved in lipid metabolism
LSVNKNQTPIINNIDQNQPSTTTKNLSLNDIAQHNNQGSCWTAIDGKVYDITNFISSHPAGVDKIMKGCGVDATTMFNRVGAHNISKLSNVFVGLLK